MADLFGDLDGRTDDSETLAALEVDYTPPAVAVQLLLALRRHLGDAWAPRRALDPAAGSGCWGRAMRAVLGVGVELVGIEPRVSERANLLAYDASFGLTLEQFIRAAGGQTTFDLVATNPPFSAFRSDCFWPLTLLSVGLLHSNSIVALYGLSSWGQSEAAQATLRSWSPMLQLRLGGRAAHRGDGSTDAREYSLWVWSCADRRAGNPSWWTEQLPVLPTALRRWSPEAVPGTYPIDPALVEQIRRGL